jgi:lipopolysaccharide transport system ATP-binding protein
MENVARGGRTVLFVSHNMAAVKSLCDNALTLERGALIDYGDASEQVGKYLSRLTSRTTHDLASRTDRDGDGRGRVESMTFRYGRTRDATRCEGGAELSVVVCYSSTVLGATVDLAISCWSDDGTRLFHCDNSACGVRLPRSSARCEQTCRLPKLPLPPGKYYFNVRLALDNRLADHVFGAATLEVDPGDFLGAGRPTPSHGAAVLVEYTWC